MFNSLIDLYIKIAGAKLIWDELVPNSLKTITKWIFRIVLFFVMIIVLIKISSIALYLTLAIVVTVICISAKFLNSKVLIAFIWACTLVSSLWIFHYIKLFIN